MEGLNHHFGKRVRAPRSERPRAPARCSRMDSRHIAPMAPRELRRANTFPRIGLQSFHWRGNTPTGSGSNARPGRRHGRQVMPNVTGLHGSASAGSRPPVPARSSFCGSWKGLLREPAQLQRFPRRQNAELSQMIATEELARAAPVTTGTVFVRSAVTRNWYPSS